MDARKKFCGKSKTLYTNICYQRLPPALFGIDAKKRFKN